MKHEIGPGQICVRCLLEIQIALSLPPRVNLHGMISDRTCSAKTRNRRAVRADSRHESYCPIIPIHDPGILHRSPPEPFDAQLDRCPSWTRQWSHFEALGNFDAVLGNRFIIDHGDDVMNTAVVFRNRKARIEMATRTNRKLAER